VEESFVADVDGCAVSGRIDAVFRREENPSLVPEGKKVLIVDWKTGNRRGNPRQLAVYAEAWASKTGTPLNEVAAGFFYVLTGEFAGVDVTTIPTSVIPPPVSLSPASPPFSVVTPEESHAVREEPPP